MPKNMTRAAIQELYARLAAEIPAPRTELHYKDPYTLLVAVTLSAQATDVGVNKATARLFEVADTPAKMVALGEAQLGAHIRTIGLWRNKAKNVIRLSQILLDTYDGEVPETREALQTLPGVGRKTANVVCNEAFGVPTIAVDTHIYRVGNRTGMARGKAELDVELRLEKVTPDIFRQHAHHWLILHGRYICKARTPECWRCPVADLCLYTPKTPGHRQNARDGGTKNTWDAKAKPVKKRTKKTKRLGQKPKSRQAQR